MSPLISKYLKLRYQGRGGIHACSVTNKKPSSGNLHGEVELYHQNKMKSKKNEG